MSDLGFVRAFMDALDASDTRWMKRAACSGLTATCFPEKGDGVEKARRICNGTPPRRARPITRKKPATPAHPGTPPCPVREECLAYAMANHEDYGVWGGTSERERRRIRKAALAVTAVSIAA